MTRQWADNFDKCHAMKKNRFHFSTGVTDCYFNNSFHQLAKLTPPPRTVIVTDQQVFKLHRKLFIGWNTIVLKSGEKYKVQATVDALIDQLISLKADRSTTLVGVGGGVITDLVGYTASVYMRGIRFGFVPTTLLAMVDASIGGKNGVDVGLYKNLAGTIRQPSFLLYDISFLSTLPLGEWQNGFAEIIKHAAILDAPLFAALENKGLSYYQKSRVALCALIKRNALLKIRVVQQDETEKGIRKWLNFGHTLGHALENQYELSHGQAISLGMMSAAVLSAHYLQFSASDRIEALLARYGLPTRAHYNLKKAIKVLAMDKKKSAGIINYVLLKKIGKAVIHPLRIDQLEKKLATQL